MGRTIQERDVQLMFWLRGKESRFWTYLFLCVTVLGSAKGWTAASLFLIFFVDVPLGWQIGLSALMGAIFAQCIKRQIKRPRPCIDGRGPPALARIPDPWSFPSGHTTSACSVSTMLFLSMHPWCWSCLCIALLVGLSRVYLGVHYPSDVLCGILLGVGSGYLFHKLWEAFYVVV